MARPKGIFLEQTLKGYVKVPASSLFHFFSCFSSQGCRFPTNAPLLEDAFLNLLPPHLLPSPLLLLPPFSQHTSVNSMLAFLLSPLLTSLDREPTNSLEAIKSLQRREILPC